MYPNADIEGRASSDYGGDAMKPRIKFWRMSRKRYDRLVDKGWVQGEVLAHFQLHPVNLRFG